jgi:DNA polymerase
MGSRSQKVYAELIDAVIGELEGQRARGHRHVALQPETWAALNQPRRAVPTAEVAGRAQPTPLAGSGGRPPPTAPAPAGKPAAVPPPATASAAPGQRTLAIEPSRAQPLTAAEKVAAMAALRARAAACRKCEHLAAARRSVVFGVGTPEAALMFVGEAPGADEDAQGEPFVGRAGQLLTRIIETMGLNRDRVYIANILKCRPNTPGQNAGNRKPTPTEMVTCLPYLLEQIDIIRPKVLVGLGATAVEGLMGKIEGITRLRGRWLEFRGTPLMPTYHPAYLLRNQAPSERRKVWEDMLEVMARLGLPISDKQRSYFLKS